MAHRGGSRSAYGFFVCDQLPELRRRGLPVTGVADAIPYCSQAWALLTKEEKMVYTEKARKWNEKKRSQKTVKEVNSEKGTPFNVAKWFLSDVLNHILYAANLAFLSSCVVDQTCNPAHPGPACLTTKMSVVASLPDASAMSWKNDQAVISDIFYFLNIYSHGKLPSYCEQRFLPCEIGCVRYSLQDGIMADFHHFIDPEEPPLGFRYYCQAASDDTHRIPVSGFHLSRTCYGVVLQELLKFVQPARGVWPHFYCRSDDRFRINWCLNRMASVTGIESHLELFAVEDLVTELYQKKYQKEPSKTWVCKELDVFQWDFSSNTRCKWHEENDILCCALASCKTIAYCISRSLASVYGVSLTAAHLPLQDSDYGERRNTKMVILDAGRFQKMKAQGSGCDRHFASSQDQESVPANCDSPCGVKTATYGPSTVRGRGITRLLKNASDLSMSFSI